MEVHVIRAFAGVFALAVCGLASGAEVPRSYADAEVIWRDSREKDEYQIYLAEFAQYNNSLRLDERDRCYSLAPGPVNLMLVISRADADGFATIRQVFHDVDNAKARCFARTYTDVRTKLPPFLPFVVQLGME
jgi:hypothetical protein